MVPYVSVMEGRVASILWGTLWRDFRYKGSADFSPYKNSDYHLQNQYCWQAVFEVPVLCLVAEHIHPGNRSYATTDHSDTYQRLL